MLGIIQVELAVFEKLKAEIGGHGSFSEKSSHCRQNESGETHKTPNDRLHDAYFYLFTVENGFKLMQTPSAHL